jgi:hypothetical protein
MTNTILNTNVACMIHMLVFICMLSGRPLFHTLDIQPSMAARVSIPESALNSLNVEAKRSAKAVNWVTVDM